MADLDVRLSDSLSVRGGHLHCEDVRVRTLQEDLLKELGQEAASPFFVYSAAQLRSNVAAYRDALERHASCDALLGYALKANNNPQLVQIVLETGCRCLVAVSGNEVRLALRLGCPPHRVIFNGNGKLLWELELAVISGCLVNVDSFFDLERLGEVTERVGKKAKVLIRVNPDIDPNVHSYLATGLSRSKFGVEESQLALLLEEIRTLRLVELVGLHCHLGSTISSTNVFRESLEVMLDLVDRVKSAGFATLEYINLGGGLGIDYRKHEARTWPPIETFTTDSVTTGKAQDARAQSIPSAYDLILSIDTERIRKAGLTLIIEPGRSVVGSAGTLVTRVIGCKRAGQTRYIVVDGAMTEVIRPAFYGAYHHIELTEPVIQTAGGNQAAANTESEVVVQEEKRANLVDASQMKDLSTESRPTELKGVERKPLYSKSTDQLNTEQADAQKFEQTSFWETNPLKPKQEMTKSEAIERLQDQTAPATGHDAPRFTFDVVGPVCECADFLGKARLLPAPHAGCGLAVLDAGAYCASMGSNYNMRTRPAEVLVEGAAWRIIRRPETFDDLLRAAI